MENNNEQRGGIKLGKVLVGLGVALGCAAYTVIKKRKNEVVDISEVREEIEEELDA